VVTVVDFDNEASVLAAHVVVPEHVAQRGFAEQSVAVNLQTGQYHGLNPTAARMVEVLGDSRTVGDAVQSLASEFDQPREVIEHDVVRLCRDLAERGLIELHGDAS
jgi:hypothetical protein